MVVAALVFKVESLVSIEVGSLYGDPLCLGKSRMLAGRMREVAQHGSVWRQGVQPQPGQGEFG